MKSITQFCCCLACMAAIKTWRSTSNAVADISTPSQLITSRLSLTFLTTSRLFFSAFYPTAARRTHHPNQNCKE